jgi:hypothetical protein
MTSRASRFGAVLVLWAVALAARYMVGDHIIDDAYITMRYSRHLAELHVISYNPPDAVLGTSTPLWMWLLALASHSGLSLPVAALAFAAIADLVSIAILLRGPFATTAGAAAALGAAIAIAAWPVYVIIAVSGMETSLYVCLIVATTAAIGRDRAVLGGGLAGAALLCRPDGALMIVVGALAAIRRKQVGRYAASVAVVAFPWIVYASWRFGSPIPTSVIAKAASDDPWFVSFLNLRAFFLHGPYLLITPLAAAGLLLLWRRGPESWRLLIGWCVLYLAAMAAANAFTHYAWYYVPLLPVYIGAAAAASGAIAEWVRPVVVARLWQVRLVPALLCAAGGALLLARMPPLAAQLTNFGAQREAPYMEVASTLHHTAPGCVLAATEIGAIGYAYPGRILDLVGLVSPEVMGRDVTAVLAESGAHWLVTYDSHFDRSAAARPEFTRLFVRRIVRPVTPGRALEVYERTSGSVCAGRSAEAPLRGPGR